MSASDGYHVYFDIPDVVFKARVNMAAVVYPVSQITFDGVTVGAFGDLIPDMTLTVGTTEGGDDLGRVRVQNFATSTEIPVGRISQGVEDGTLDLQDDAYITVYDDYRVWAKIPVMNLDDEEDIDTFKDSDIPVLSFNDEIPPVANCGPFVAGYVDDVTGLLTVQFPKDGVDVSYAVAEGATLTDYLWDVEDGTITVGTSASAVITATFPPGRRWVGLTVTDSNGKVQTSRTFVLSVDPDDDPTYPHAGSINHQLSQEGQKVDVELNAPLPRDTYMDGCLVLIWEGQPASPGDRSHMRFCGWQQSEDWNLRANKQGLSKNTTVNCVDVAGRLMLLPGFSQALERNDEEQKWEYMPDLSFNKVLNYLIGWHTTALSLADYIVPESDYPALRLDTTGGTLFEQADSTGKKRIPRTPLTCTPAGELIYREDWMEVDVADRPAATLVLNEDTVGEVRSQYNRQPKVHVLTCGTLLSTGEWIYIEGEKDVPIAFSKAPGYAFSQGTNEVIESEGLALSQADLNEATGHRYARHNARYSPFSITFSDTSDVWLYAPAYMERVQLDIPAEYAAQRGLDFTTAYGQIKDLSIRVTPSKKGNKVDATLNWEKETFGGAGITHIPEEADDTPDDITPDPELPTEPVLLPDAPDVLAGIGIDGWIYRTSDFQDATPTWDRVDTGIADTIYSWVVDPFSPGYINQNGSGAVNGWIVNDTDIYRVEDIFGTPTVESVYTFDEPTVAASYHWRSIQASFGAFFEEGSNPWLLCVSYYGNTAGKEGTWATHSIDGGATWAAEVQISEALDPTTRQRFRPIGVYTSPKTPGLGYTAAYIGEGGTPEELMPVFGTAPDIGAVTVEGPGTQLTWVASATSVPAGGVVSVAKRGWFAPPPDAKRVVTRLDWIWTTIIGGGGSSANGGLSDGEPLTITRDAASLGMVHPGDNNTTTGTITTTWTKSGTADWPGNNVTLPTTHADPANIRVAASANGSATSTVTVTMTVTEIELEDGTIYTPTLSNASGFKTADWGETWEQYGDIDPGDGQAGTIHVPWEDNADEGVIYHGKLTTEAVEGTPDELMPFFGRTYQNDVTPFSYTALGYGPSGTVSNTSIDHAGGPHDEDNVRTTLIIAPPADTVRMIVEVVWNANNSTEGGFSGHSASMSLWSNNNATRTGSDDFSSPPEDGSNFGSFTLVWTRFSGTTWHINSTTIQSSPPTSDTGCRITALNVTSAVGAGNTVTTTITYTATVTEIEMEDGTIYTPVESSGSRSYKTIRITDGAAVDVSPSDVDRSYGVNRGHFGLRAHDSNRQLVLASVTGNDATSDPADDFHAVYKSESAGSAWEEIVAPTADSLAPSGRPAYEAAWGGVSEEVIFIWGRAEYIKYSDDGGATLQDKEGNLSSFSPSGWIGICGGPLGG